MLTWCRHLARWWLAGALLLGAGGCAAVPYEYGASRNATSQDSPAVLIEYGEPNKTLDRLAWCADLPSRIIHFRSEVDDRQISSETTDKLEAYLKQNGLTDVHVYINHYDPQGQWRRLRENERIAPGWRYSVGALSVVGYTLFPVRVYGGDRYNPYTNSLNLAADVPAVILSEAAVAKDVYSRSMPGTYATLNQLPLISLWKSSNAIGDVVGYARDQDDWDLEKEAYHKLYPRFGMQTTSVGGILLPSIWLRPVLHLSGAAVGHVAGRRMIARRAAEVELLHAASNKPADEGDDKGFVEMAAGEEASDLDGPADGRVSDSP